MRIESFTNKDGECNENNQNNNEQNNNFAQGSQF